MSAASIVIAVVFGAAGSGYLVRSITASGIIGRTGDGLHVVMSATMIVMIVARPGAGILLGEVAFFLAATAFYVVLLRLRHSAIEVPSAHHSGGPRLGFHVVMMASMAGMAGFALLGISSVPVAVEASGRGGQGAHAGMSMGLTGVTALGLGPGVLLAIFFAGASIWYAALVARAARSDRARAVNPALLMLMSVGTTLALAPSGIFE